MLIYVCQQLLKGISSLSLGSWIYKQMSLFGICDMECGLVLLHVPMELS